MENQTLTLSSSDKPPTYAEQWRQMAASLKQEACHLLQWEEQQYCDYQYQMGIAYLMWYLPCDEDGRRQLECSRLYWNWWKHTWSMYDDSFFSFKIGLKKCSLQTRRTAYKKLHCPRTMAVEIRPNDVVLAELKTKEVYA